MERAIDGLRVGKSDLKEAGGAVWADQHCEVVEVEHSDRVAVGVKDVVVCDPVLPGAGQDHRGHRTKLP
jgi:hypothetical protein